VERNDHLFFQADSFAVQEHQRKEMEAGIAGLDGNRLLNTNVDDLVSYFAENYRVDVPLLDKANMSVEQREARRDVSGDPSPMAYFTGQGPVHVLALLGVRSRLEIVSARQVRVLLPFDDDSNHARSQL
jgi:hypothetical protein